MNDANWMIAFGSLNSKSPVITPNRLQIRQYDGDQLARRLTDLHLVLYNLHGVYGCDEVWKPYNEKASDHYCPDDPCLSCTIPPCKMNATPPMIMNAAATRLTTRNTMSFVTAMLMYLRQLVRKKKG